VFRSSASHQSIALARPLPYLMQQSLWSVFFVGLLVLSSAMAVVYIKHLYRNVHTQLQNLRDQRDQLHIEWTQLLLEQSALASDMRVEQIARDELGMIFPAPDKIVIIRP
jgi:cell division protein FtsL